MEVECIRGHKGCRGDCYLERFVGDWARDHADQVPMVCPAHRQTRGIVGAGPGGLTAAASWSSAARCTIYEALHKPGVVLDYGIPEFRLPKKIVEAKWRGSRPPRRFSATP